MLTFYKPFEKVDINFGKYVNTHLKNQDFIWACIDWKN